jgi:cytochrome o ubiquinol oxidase subunit 2
MNKKIRWILGNLLFLGIATLVFLFLEGKNIAMLDPKGTIAEEQKKLLIITTWLMMIVVLPVFILTIAIPWKYRKGNPKAKYAPNWDNSHMAEIIWWSLPFAVVIVLSIITWKSCHDLDPYKPLVSENKPVKVQVVALDWKWLFIYPEFNIATVNYLQFPEKTPVNFDITADAPMNSLWIPELGGQIYAMAGMKTKLHLIANAPGRFNGSSANLSGKGFAGMKFIAEATSAADFAKWIKEVKASSNFLTLEEYNKLAEPSENNPAAFYVLKAENLYEQIVMKYMGPMHDK